MSNFLPHLVLVHGAWHGGWSWDPVPNLLRSQGFDVSVIDQLPSTQENPAAGLRADAIAVREIVDNAAKPVVLVGHSYGGMVVSELSGEPGISAVVYVAAFVPQHGESVLDLVGGQLPPWILLNEAGTYATIDHAAASQLVGIIAETPEAVDDNLARTVPHAVTAFSEPSSSKGWGAVPVSYLLATRDDVIPPIMQAAMARSVEAVVTEIDAPHLPTQSEPVAVANFIAQAAVQDTRV